MQIEEKMRPLCHPLTVRVGSRKLSARLYSNTVSQRQSRRPGVLFIHGLQSSQSTYADRAEAVVRELGATCLTIDLSGHGDSEGALRDITPRDHVEEVVAAFDLLAQNAHVDASRIGVCASSYGAYLATLLTSSRSVARMLLRAPGLYDDSDLDTTLDVPRISNPRVDVLEVVACLQEFLGRVLILEGEFDEVIPHEVIEVYLKASNDPDHVVIPGARHALRDEQTRNFFRDVILRFFAGL